MTDPITLPEAVPVMPLPGALLFPHALLPLYIFEVRYQQMLAHALQHDRMFGVALIDPRRTEWNSVYDFNHVATVGLIRACVGRGDGTSNLILQGLQRVRFIRFRQEKPFPIALIEPLASTTADRADTEVLVACALELYARLKRKDRPLPEKLDEYLSHLSDPGVLADLLAATFVSDPARRQELLEQLSVVERLRLVNRYLQEETGDAAA